MKLFELTRDAVNVVKDIIKDGYPIMIIPLLPLLVVVFLFELCIVTPLYIINEIMLMFIGLFNR